MISDHTPHRKTSRTVKSRYLSPVSATEPPPWLPPSPNNHNKPKSSLLNTELIRGVWPKSHTDDLSSSTTTTTATLADYLGNDRKRDKGNSMYLRKQRSCSEFSRFENNPTKPNDLKENQKPVFGGGSMRYTGKFSFRGRSSTSSSSSIGRATEEPEDITPGRLSVDENELRRRSYARMRPDSFSDNSTCSDTGSPLLIERNSLASYMAPTLSSRNSIVNSPTKSVIKNAMKKANSLSLPSKWGSSFGRSESPQTPKNLKPPTSPSRTSKKNFLHMGLDLIKSKKNGSGCLSPLGAGMGMVESVHKLRMMHGSWMQWRYANARANVVHETLDNKAKEDSLNVWENIVKLQQSVLLKRLQLEKEKLEMKLDHILHSQMAMLEAWRGMEKNHTSNVSMTKVCLEAVACSVPLIEGAKMDPQMISIALGHATDMAAYVMSKMSSLLTTTQEVVSPFSELAKVVIEEKLLLEECFEHLGIISTLEVEERSLRCYIVETIQSKHQ